MQGAVEPEAAQVETAMAMVPSGNGTGGEGNLGKSEKEVQPPRLSAIRTVSRKLAFAQNALVMEPEWQRRLQRLANAIVRGAGAGFCLRGGINLVRCSALFCFVYQPSRNSRIYLWCLPLSFSCNMYHDDGFD